jgi:hypothetical protein
MRATPTILIRRATRGLGPWLSACLLFGGCARDLSKPDAGGESCEHDRDCNRDDGGARVACGALRACVAGRCEHRDADAGGPGSWVVTCGPGNSTDDDAGQ